MYLVAGLGNPGREYESTRHNMGFMAVDSLIRRYASSGEKQKFKGLLSEGKLCDEKALFLKPQTFMNLSGVSVAEAADFYKIPLDKIIVFHDDMDIPFGKIKIKQGGGAAGHNGLRSLDSHLGNNYWRFRMGIGHPDIKEQTADFVLSPLKGADLQQAELLFEKTAELFPLFLQKGAGSFLNELFGQKQNKKSA
jgi:peptidyl-tRNA hydrolase, PTH1 family